MYVCRRIFIFMALIAANPTALSVGRYVLNGETTLFLSHILSSSAMYATADESHYCKVLPC